MEEHVDLTIIGAGPTGLTVALLARRLGMSVCIIDKAPGPLKFGRADALNARTQELLESIDVLPRLENAGLKCNTLSKFNFFQREFHFPQEPLVDINVYRPNFLIIGQPDIERELRSKLDIPVRQNCVVSRVVEDVEGCIPIVRTHFENTVVLSKFALGADGARSFVREQPNIPFEGTEPGMMWTVMDTFIDTDFPVCPEIITFEIDGQARVSWIPRERGMARFYVLLEGERTQARAEAKIKECLAPYRANFLRTEWFSIYDVKERLVRTCFSPLKRIVLAGDAAHIHSVSGGQGVNTGIADAFALTWRIKLALSGYDSALPSYEPERLDTARNVIDVAAKLIRSRVGTAEEFLRLIALNATYITGIGINYVPHLPVTWGTGSGIFQPGQRCPDIYLHTEGAEDRSVSAHRFYTLVKYGKFVVLDFQNRVTSRYQHVPLNAAWARFVDTWNVGDNSSLALEDGDPTHKESQHFTHITANGSDKPIQCDNPISCIVIRPDTYVGYVGWDARSYFELIFAKLPTCRI